MTGLLYSPRYRPIERALVCVTILVYGAAVAGAAACLPIDDPAVRYAVAFIAVQCAVQGALISGLVISKRLRTAAERRRGLRMRTLEDLLSRPEAADEALSAAARWPREFLTVVEAAIQTLSGSARRRLIGMLESSAPYRGLLRESEHGNPGVVIHALSLLGRLETPEARHAVRGCLRHPAEAVRRAARKAVIVNGSEEARREVLGGLGGLPLWERLILFQTAPSDHLLNEFLAQALSSQDDERVLVALEFVISRQRLVPFPVSSALAVARNLEVRIKFFRALPFVRVEEGASPILVSGLDDPDWRVRAAAARAAGALRAGQYADRLLRMCEVFDNPAEAGHAARALSALGGDAWARLQHSVSRGEAGGRIAAEVVERRLVGPEASR